MSLSSRRTHTCQDTKTCKMSPISTSWWLLNPSSQRASFKMSSAGNGLTTPSPTRVSNSSSRNYVSYFNHKSSILCSYPLLYSTPSWHRAIHIQEEENRRRSKSQGWWRWETKNRRDRKTSWTRKRSKMNNSPTNRQQ